ncbi:MAG: hypothetical protein ACR2QW_11480 [bacterium]
MTIASTSAIFGTPESLEKEDMATVSDLKARLDTLGIEYKSKATKAELEALIPEKKPVPEREPKVREATARVDIKITCMVETLDGSVHETEIRIVNPLGCIPAAYVNNPERVYSVLRSGLESQLGKAHVK